MQLDRNDASRKSTDHSADITFRALTKAILRFEPELRFEEMLQYLKQQVRTTEDLENQVVIRTEMARCHLILADAGAEANTEAEEQLREAATTGAKFLKSAQWIGIDSMMDSTRITLSVLSVLRERSGRCLEPEHQEQITVLGVTAEEAGQVGSAWLDVAVEGACWLISSLLPTADRQPDSDVVFCRSAGGPTGEAGNRGCPGGVEAQDGVGLDQDGERRSRMLQKLVQ